MDMISEPDMRSPETLKSHTILSTKAGEWLPPHQQILDALQLHIEEPTEGAESASFSTEDNEITLRQGMAMVVIMALIAGLLPFFANWIFASRMETALPLATLVRFTEQQALSSVGTLDERAILAETTRTIAGIESTFPGWLSAGISALGEWINWPLRWLTVWLVYGLFVLSASKVLGATATLHRFYATTSYAVAPLLLLAFSPIPYLGPVLSLVAYVWAATIYIWAVRTITGFDIGPALLCVILPVLVALVLGLVIVSTAVGAVLGLTV